MKKRHLFATMILLLPLASLAQDHKEMAGISYLYIPVKLHDTSARVQRVDMDILFPIFKKPNSSLTGKAEFGTITFSDFPGEKKATLYGISFQGAYTRKIDDRVSLTLFGQIGVFSDMEDISGEDFRGTIGFQYKIKKSENFKYGLGVAYANQFFGHQISPYITVDYHPSEKWYFFGQFPTKINAEYALTKKDFLGFGIRGLTSSYRLSKDTRSSDFATKSSFIQTSQWSAKLSYERFFYKKWSVNASAGYTFVQTYRQYDDIPGSMLNSWTILTIPVGKKRPEPAQEIKKNGMLYQVGISYNIF